MLAYLNYLLSANFLSRSEDFNKVNKVGQAKICSFPANDHTDVKQNLC